MNTRLILLPLAAALLAVAGCDFGGVAEEEDPALESSQVEFRLSSRAPTSAPGATVTESAPVTEVGDDPTGQEAAARDTTRPTADCIDLSSGTPLLVPCTVRQAIRTAPAGHDDPDPWRPVATPVNPTF